MTVLKKIFRNSSSGGGGGGSAVWGDITGTLSSQTDLQSALNAKQATLTSANFGSFSNGLTEKTTPVDADSLNLVDSEASNVEKKVTWANIKATLKAYFDTLYASISSSVKFTAGSYNGISTLTYGATITPNFNTSKNFEVVLTGNATLGFPDGLDAGQQGFITVWQNSTGNNTLGYHPVYEPQGGAVPLISPLKGIKSQLYYCVNVYREQTVTNTIGTDTFTAVANNLKYGSKIRYKTTGSLPTGIAVDTDYWVNPTGADTFTVASSYANLSLGAYISTSGSQSGVHSFVEASITLSVNPAVRRD